MCEKRSPDEKVGVVCKKNGKYDIVEYSELSQEEANKLDEDGNLYFNLGSILIFMLSSKKFACRVVGKGIDPAASTQDCTSSP